MPKKILFVASGKSFHATRWANALSRRGLKVYFYATTNVIRELDSNVEVINGSSMKSKARYIIKSFHLKNVITQYQPDIIHAHYASGNGLLAALSILLLRRSRIRFLVSLYGTEVFEFTGKSAFHRLIMKFVATKATRVLSTSRAMAIEFNRYFPELDKPTITPFGVDIDVFSPYPAAPTTILTIGMLKKMEHKYGVDLLLKAFASLKASFPSTELRLIIAGGGTRLHEYKTMSDKMGLNNYVEFLDWIPNSSASRFLNQCDIVVVPSRCQESFGVSAVEAMACGIPVVASNSGGLTEVIRDRVGGLLFETNNAKDLEQKLAELVLNPEQRKSLGENARAIVLDNYNWEKNVDAMVGIYNESLTQPKCSLGGLFG